MGKQIKFHLILALLLFQSGMLLSQGQTDITKLETGKNYKIVLFDGSEIIGRFIKTDSIYIKIEQVNRSIDLIPANDIKYFTANLSAEKYTFSVSIMSGASFLLGKYYPYEGTPGNKVSLNLNLSGMLYLSDSKAIRIDAGYSNIPAANSLSATTLPPYYTSVTGGEMTLLSLKASFILGRFKPSEKFMYYGALGFGVHFASRNPITMQFNYQPYDTAQFVGGGSQSFMATIWINPIISAAAAVGYRFSKHFGVNAEVEYIMILGSGESMFTGKRNYFPLRAGLFYIF